MESKNLIKFINNPELLNKDSLEFIEGILDEYPYFQAGHLLYLKNLKNINKPNLIDNIHYSSAFIPDRQVLYEFLHFIDDKRLIANQNNQKSKVDKSSLGKDQEIQIEESIIKNVDSSKKTESSNENQNIRRRITNGFGGMADNISDTLTRQLKHYNSSNDEELKYSPELFSLEEKNSKDKKEEDILFIDENLDKDDAAQEEVFSKENLDDNSDDNTELLEIDNDKKKIKNNLNDFYDINKFADNVDFSEQNKKSEKELLSETLIKVYIKQEYFNKAINAYEKLSLKYPKKKTYFASQIEIIKELKSKQKNK